MDFKVLLMLVISHLAFLTIVTDAARILGIFSIKAKSHYLFNEEIMRSLANAGHKVTIFAPYPLTKPMANIKLIDSGATKFNPIWSTLNLPAFMFIINAILILKRDCEELMQMKEFQEILHSTEKRYDIMFLEMLSFNECYLPLAEKLNIPVIGTTSLRSWMYADYAVGNSASPAYIPTILTDTGSISSFYSRLISLIYVLFVNSLQLSYEIPNLRTIHERYYSSYDLNYTKKVSLVFTNNHPIILSRPNVPNSVEIGGLKIKSTQLVPLPESLQTFIDEATHGVILFSMGSNNDYLSSNMRIIFKNVFSRISQRIIWKSEMPMDDLSENIYVVRWLPQIEILHHRNVKAFITHCGLNSIYEAIHSATPMILMPVHTDQGYNAYVMENRGAGVRVDISTMTEEILQNALGAVINDTRYKENVEELARIFNDRPMPPNESVVYWTEYVLKYNEAPHLRTTAADMPLYQYLLFDVIIFLVVVVFSIFLVLFLLAKTVYTFLCKSTKNKNTSTLSAKMEKKVKKKLI